MNRDEPQLIQKIINFFERSVSQSGGNYDFSLGIYGVIDQNGQVYRANPTLAGFFAPQIQDVLDLNLSYLFSSKDWKEFRQCLGEIRKDRSQSRDFEFRLMVGDNVLRHRVTVVAVTQVRSDVPPFYTIIGSEVAEPGQLLGGKSLDFEMAATRAIQNKMFPLPQTSFGTAQLAGFSLASDDRSGDLWSHIRTGNKLFIWIGDVTGHGVSTAEVLTTVEVALAFIDFGTSTLVEVLSFLSRAVGAMAVKRKVMTFCLICVDLETGECRSASAGHNHAFRATAGDGTYALEGCVDFPYRATHQIGLGSSEDYFEWKIQLQSGDRIVLYTDGIEEVVNAQDELWQRRSCRVSLQPLLAQHPDVAKLSKAIEFAINDFRGTTPLPDDVTVIVFQF